MAFFLAFRALAPPLRSALAHRCALYPGTLKALLAQNQPLWSGRFYLAIPSWPLGPILRGRAKLWRLIWRFNLGKNLAQWQLCE